MRKGKLTLLIFIILSVTFSHSGRCADLMNPKNIVSLSNDLKYGLVVLEGENNIEGPNSCHLIEIIDFSAAKYKIVDSINNAISNSHIFFFDSGSVGYFSNMEYDNYLIQRFINSDKPEDTLLKMDIDDSKWVSEVQNFVISWDDSTFAYEYNENAAIGIIYSKKSAWNDVQIEGGTDVTISHDKSQILLTRYRMGRETVFSEIFKWNLVKPAVDTAKYCIPLDVYMPQRITTQSPVFYLKKDSLDNSVDLWNCDNCDGESRVIDLVYPKQISRYFLTPDSVLCHIIDATNSLDDGYFKIFKY